MPKGQNRHFTFNQYYNNKHHVVCKDSYEVPLYIIVHSPSIRP